MKKAFILIIVLAISTQIYAKIKAKHIVGTWTYNVETPDGQAMKRVCVDGPVFDAYTVFN